MLGSAIRFAKRYASQAFESQLSVLSQMSCATLSALQQLDADLAVERLRRWLR